MAAKQLTQAITHPDCEIPMTIGSNYRHLTYNCNHFRLTAQDNGEVIYKNNNIMVLIYYNKHSTSKHETEVYDISPIQQCSSLYSTRLTYCVEEGRFNKGDILYEYDSFKNGLPTYGYNLWTAYLPFFSYNHEDAIVISESAAERCKGTKTETVLIPIYTYSLFKHIYPDSKYRFIPERGQKINDTTICVSCVAKNSNTTDPADYLKQMCITDFSTMVNNEHQFSYRPIPSRIQGAKIHDIRIHQHVNKGPIDASLSNIIKRMYEDYQLYCLDIYQELMDITSKEEAVKTIGKYYINTKTLSKTHFDLSNLLYVLEVTVEKEYSVSIGDKLANRYANKGVVSKIIPDDLRPKTYITNHPIDCMVLPISVLSRMNFGQVPECIISKMVYKANLDIKQHPSKTEEVLDKLYKITKKMNNDQYAIEIDELKYNMIRTPGLRQQFLDSVDKYGLYYEAPNFAYFDQNEVTKEIEQQFNIPINEAIVMKKELLETIREDMQEPELPLPNTDTIILKNIFTGPIYMLKLKQDSASRVTCRDFGTYKAMIMVLHTVMYVENSVNSGEA